MARIVSETCLVGNKGRGGMDTTINIADVLRKHALCLQHKAGGEFANLCGADLSKATMPDGRVHN